MLIHCTKKLAAKIPELSSTPLVDGSPLGSWHAHLYHYDRRQCVLLCHDESRYCLFLPGLVKADFAELGKLHRELFMLTLARLNLSEALLKRVGLALGPVRYDRNTDRSVLGSLRTADVDLSYLIYDCHVMDCSPLRVALELNERPTSVRGDCLYPTRVMMDLINRL